MPSGQVGRLREGERLRPPPQPWLLLELAAADTDLERERDEIGAVGPLGSSSRTARAPEQHAAQDEYDGFSVFRGIMLGVLLSVPVWVWVALKVREILD